MESLQNLTPAQRYYQTHKDAKKEYGRNYYYANRDKILKSIKDKKEKPSILIPVAPSPLDAHRGRGIKVADAVNTIVYFD